MPRGRPKAPKGLRKEERLVLRVSLAEKREIIKAATHAGSGGASAWVRMVALQEARRIK